MKKLSFRLNILLRVVLLALTLLLALYLALQTAFYLTTLLVSLAVVAQVWLLVRYVESITRDLQRLLSAIRWGDFTLTFPKRQQTSLQPYYQSLNEVMAAFREAKLETEEREQFMQTILHHLAVGVVVVDEQDRIVLHNQAVKRLLKVPRVAVTADLPEPVQACVERLHSGGSELLTLPVDKERLQLVIKAERFSRGYRPMRLVSLQNVARELDEREQDAWQNLIRVLTHEMMNSITPITSLASSARETVDDVLAEQPQEDLQDVQQALSTIERRSQGLLQFVETYRSLTKIPKPSFRQLDVAEVFDQLLQLLEQRLQEQGVQIQVEVVPPGLQLTADPQMVEQMLINLLLNALDAVRGREEPQVVLKGYVDAQSRTVLQVCDNGPGIQPEAREKIFVPFFTTKKHGSGIGLSLSRQMMRLHKGTIEIFSEPGVETVVSLRF